MGPGDLEKALAGLLPAEAEELVVGYETADDAAVYRMADGTMLVQTVDFFTPIVDSPRSFGRIAAANALSDIYAMGGTPLTCMNIVGFPCGLGMEVLAEILAGGAEKVAEAGAALIGGHTVDDAEPKYGMAVTGRVHEGEMTPNSAARPGDLVYLTKPLGTGILATALKGGFIDEAGMADAVRGMESLNELAADAARALGCRSVTDITGFGLIGHLLEVARASGVSIALDPAAVPLYEGVLELAGRGLVPGGTAANREHFGRSVKGAEGLEPALRDAFYDAQTSGGLALFVPPGSGAEAAAVLAAAGLPAHLIGEARDVAGEPLVTF